MDAQRQVLRVTIGIVVLGTLALATAACDGGGGGTGSSDGGDTGATGGDTAPRDTFDRKDSGGSGTGGDTGAEDTSADPDTGPSTDTGGSPDAGEVGVPVDECTNAPGEWIWCDDFEKDRLSSYFEHKKKNGSFVRKSGVGIGGSTGMRAQFDSGQVAAGALHLAFGDTPQSYFDSVTGGNKDYREIYWRWYVKYESSWQGGGGAKMSRATSFASSSSWAQAMIAHLWSGGENQSKYYLVLDPASGTDRSGNLQTTKYNDFNNLRWLGNKQGQTPIFDSSHVGEWYCVEAHVRLNDPNKTNGTFEYWIDGSLEARSVGLNWVGDFQNYGINAVFLENYWNDGSPQKQERYFDNFVVSSSRIGCGN